MKTIYLAKQNADLCEGRGPAIIIAAFTIFADAKWVNDGLPGPQGSKNDCPVEEMLLYESVAEYTKLEKDRIRAGALSKLTKREKEILGIHE